MLKKPSYEELEKQLRELERKVSKPEQLERHRHQEEFEKFIFNIPGVIYQFSATRDHSYNLEFMNPEKLVAIFGFDSSPEAAFEDFVAHLPDDDKERFLTSVRKAVTQIKPWFYEGRFIKPNGETIWFSGTSAPQIEGELIIFYGILMDISWQKQMEASLRLTQFCFDSSAIGIYHVQSDGRILSANAHSAHMLGYTVEELSGKFVWDIDPTIHPDTFNYGWRQLITEQSQVFESTTIKKDGTRIPVELTTNLLEYDGQQFIVSFVQDITKRKRIEEELRITQFSFENANIGIYRIASNGQIMEVNREAARLLGYSQKELKSLSIMDIDPAIDHESWAHACQVLSEDRPYDLEREHRRKDGSVFPVEVVARCLDYDGQKYIFAFAYDISKRKQAEKALKKNEQLLSNIIASIKEGLLVLDGDFNYTIFNRSMEALTGIAKEQALGKTPWEVFPYIKNTPAEKNIRAAMNEEPIDNHEMQFTFPTGEKKWFQDSFSALKDSNGNLSGVIGVISEITERKQAEQERERLIKELKEALENVKTLGGLLPICASCKKIRDDKGYWKQIESYIHEHSEAEFSHGICPDCAKELYPELNHDCD